jgi:3D (Asp-Asp-Asp) domain-containing protein
MSYPRCILWLALVSACSSGAPASDHPPASKPARPATPAPSVRVDIVADEIEPAEELESGKRLGRYQLTYYHIANQADGDVSRAVALRDRRGRIIARVSRKFSRRLLMQGTGRLRDGRLINIAGGCRKTRRCYHILDDDLRFGMGAASTSLRPFRSVAAPPHIRLGTVLYIPELDGLPVPGGMLNGNRVHDGCVVAEDRGGGIKGRQLDLFTFTGTRYRLFHRKNKIVRVTVHRGGDRCKAFADNAAPAAISGQG